MSGATQPQAAASSAAPLADASDKWRAIISLAIIAMFGGLGAALIVRTVTDSPSLQLIAGALVSQFSAVVNYWMGGSAGGTKAHATIAAIVGTPNSQP